MSAIVSKLIAAGIPEWLARPLLIGALVAALVAGLGLAKCAYDRELIASHDAAAEAKAEREAREREHRADTATNPIAKQNAADQADRQEAIRNAAQDHPQEVRRPSGPATNAVAERLRERQRKAVHPGG